MGNVIQIRCNVTNQTFSIGSKADYVDPKLRSKFAKYLASEITILVVKAINDQRYRVKWVPLNPRYYNWKREHKLSLNTWEATGYLKSKVSFDLEGPILDVGIDEYARYKDGTSVLRVAQWLEFGTKRMPERPLFRPIIRYVRSNVRYFYSKFMNEGGGTNEIPYDRWSNKLLQEFISKYSLRVKRR